MSMGLHGFSETMRGTWTPEDGSGRRVFWFRVDADATDAWGYLKDGSMALGGTLFAEGLAEGVATEGQLQVQIGQRRIAYFLSFVSADGQRCTFEGEKALSARHPFASATTLLGAIHSEAHGQLGSAVLRFDLAKDLVPFLRTFRPARALPAAVPELAS